MFLIESQTLDLIGRLFKTLSHKRKNSFLKILPIAIFAGITDVLVLTIVSRLFSVIIGKKNTPPIPYSELINIDPISKVLILIVIYILLNWLASSFRLLLRGSQERLRASIFLDLSELAQKNIFNQNYEFFLSNNSEEIISKILLNITRVSEKLIRPILQIFSGIFTIIFIFIAILFFAKVTAFYLIIGLVIGYTFISLLVTPLIKNSIKQRIKLELEITSVITESVRTITEVHLTNSERFFQEKYFKAGRKAFPFLWKAETLPEFPRALVEPFGITLIFLFGLIPVYIGINTVSLLEIIPFLATIAVASLKLTPPLQDLFRGITDLRSSIPDLQEALKILELKKMRNYSTLKRNEINNIMPKESISLKNIYYKYPTSKSYTLNDINLKILVGSNIAFVGKTGSGKSTTAAIILSLLFPQKGKLLLDRNELSKQDIQKWYSHCSYVPQTINLLNSDIISNIAYGVRREEVDKEKVLKSIEIAQLNQFIQNLPKGLNTEVGQNGVRLSGGQRQRIAIARAFYRDTKLLILDEATSALDNITEFQLLNSVKSMNKKLTIIFIAHRLSTVQECDMIYEFKGGSIKAFGKYNELINLSKSFKEMINKKNKFE